MVLAEGEERDRTFDDLGDLAVRATQALGRKGGQQLRVALVARGRVEQCPEKATRSRDRARRLEVEPQSGQDLGQIALVPEPVGFRYVPGLIGSQSRLGLVVVFIVIMETVIVLQAVVVVGHRRLGSGC